MTPPDARPPLPDPPPDTPVPVTDPFVSLTLDDLRVAGVVVEVDAATAEALGAFTETALDAADAWEANADVEDAIERADRLHDALHDARPANRPWIGSARGAEGR